MDAGQAIARQQALKQPKPADTVFSDAANNGGEDTTAPFQNAGEGETGSGLVASVGSPPPPPSLQEALQEETLQFLNVPPPPPPDDTDTLVSPPDRGAPVDSSSGEYEIAESKAGNRARGAPVACSPQSLTGMVPPLSPDEMRTLLESFNLPLFGDAEVLRHRLLTDGCPGIEGRRPSELRALIADHKKKSASNSRRRRDSRRSRRRGRK
eukprot:INCI348.1.p1 GENE.INCI348.1~~INCI348.1.p1  ORF type:complete len:210 (+),score=40.69 INCI348.1:43-672(+)